jgi:deazaflavin-dependent oxidoreductase (nitroreductase family)
VLDLREGVMLGMTSLHRTIYRLSGRRLLGDLGGMRVLEITTTGRKSGQPRTVMLTVPVEHEGNPVVVASRGGDDRHPAWYLNMLEHPEVQVATRSGTETYRARVATDTERAALWPQVTAQYSGYAGYERRTDRVIPLVVLEPVG